MIPTMASYWKKLMKSMISLSVVKLLFRKAVPTLNTMSWLRRKLFLSAPAVALCCVNICVILLWVPGRGSLCL